LPRKLPLGLKTVESSGSKSVANCGNLRLRVLKTPYRSPEANSLCERLIGSLRRECLDWAIPLSEGHLRSLSGLGKLEEKLPVGGW
jgi:hypothetical protein